MIAGDAEVNELHQEVEDKVYGLLARQAPVASDLRLRGHRAAHRRRPRADGRPGQARGQDRPAPPPGPRRAGRAGPGHPGHGRRRRPDRRQDQPGRGQPRRRPRAAELEPDDDAMDELHKGLFVVLLGAAWRHGVESAIDGALLGRFYERYADHAVNAGHQHVLPRHRRTAALAPRRRCPMREEFHAELAEVSGLLVAMADEVRDAMKRATVAAAQRGRRRSAKA